MKKNKKVDEREIQSRIIKLNEEIQKDESDSSALYLGRLDKLVAKGVYKKGAKNLARNIMRNSSKHMPKRKGSFLFDIALYTSGLSMIATAFIIGLVFLELNNGNQDDSQIGDRLQYGEQFAQAMFQPSNLTEGGFVAQNSTLTITVPGTLQGNPKDYLTIQPEVDFAVQQAVVGGNTILTIIPVQSLGKGEEYALTFNPIIAEEVDNGQNVESINAVTWVIDVDPDIEIMETYPTNGKINVPIDEKIQIKFNTDQIDINSVNNLFTISPNITGSVYLENNNYIFDPIGALVANTQYTVTLKNGIYGLNSETLTEDYSFSFTTAKLTSTGNWVSNSDFYFYDGEEPASVQNSISGLIHDSTAEKIKFNLYAVNYDSYVDILLHGDSALINVIAQNMEVRETTVEGSETFQFGFDGNQKGYYLLTAQPENSASRIYKLYNVTDYSLIEYNNNLWIYDLNLKKLVTGAAVSCLNSDGTVSNALVGEQDGKYEVTNCDIWITEVNQEKVLIMNQSEMSVNLSGKTQTISSNIATLTGKSSEYKISATTSSSVILSGESQKLYLVLTDSYGRIVPNKNITVTVLPVVEVTNTKGVSKYSNTTVSKNATTGSDGKATVEFSSLSNGIYDVVIKVEGDGIIKLSKAFEVLNLYTTYPQTVTNNIYVYKDSEGQVYVISNIETSGIVINNSLDGIDYQLFTFVGNQKLFETKFSYSGVNSNTDSRNGDGLCVVIFSDVVLYECL